MLTFNGHRTLLHDGNLETLDIECYNSNYNDQL